MRYTKEKPRRDFTPLKMMCKFIENDGDPSAYLEAMSVSHPEHPFCQTLIACETTDQFLSKLKSLEQKLPILFGDKSKALLLWDLILLSASQEEWRI